MFVSTFIIAFAGTWVTEKIIIPRLGKYEGEEKPEEIKRLSPGEKRGLKFALAAGVIFTLIVLWGVVPANGFLRHPETGDLLRSPFLSAIVAFMCRYDKKAGIGTVIATMLPYTIVFGTIWIILLVIWMILGIPVGPGAALFLPH